MDKIHCCQVFDVTEGPLKIGNEVEHRFISCLFMSSRFSSKDTSITHSQVLHPYFLDSEDDKGE